MSDPAILSDLLRRLITSHLSAEHTTQEQILTSQSRLLPYCLRILSSRLYPTHVRDEFALLEHMKKKLLLTSEKTGRIDDKTNSDVLKLTEFNRMLHQLNPSQTHSQQKNALNDKWSILYLLFALQSSANKENTDAIHKQVALLQAHAHQNITHTNTYNTQQAHESKDNYTSTHKAIMPVNHSTTSASLPSAASLSSSLSQTVPSATRLVVPGSSSSSISIKSLSGPTDLELIRDVLYIFQGVDGTFIKFTTPFASSPSQAFLFTQSELHKSIPIPKQKLLFNICHLGWLYRKICDYINQTLERSNTYNDARHMMKSNTTTSNNYVEKEKQQKERDRVGLIEQAFCSALQSELNEYYRLIALLENQVQDALLAHKLATQHIQTGEQNTTPPSSTALHFSLLRLWIFIQDPLQRLNVLCILSESVSSGSLKGGEILSQLYIHTNHGDYIINNVLKRVLYHVSLPILHQISRWCTVGELIDPFFEFFIGENYDIPMEQLWEKKFFLKKSMIPVFFPKKIAKKILIAGKALNFIRHNCHDLKFSSDFIVDQSLLFSNTAASSSSSASTTTHSSSPSSSTSISSTETFSLSALETSLDACLSVTNSHLLSLIFFKYRALTHLENLRKYLLFVQGDFTQHFFENVSKELDKPWREISQNYLSAQLKQAILSTTAAVNHSHQNNAQHNLMPPAFAYLSNLEKEIFRQRVSMSKEDGNVTLPSTMSFLTDTSNSLDQTNSHPVNRLIIKLFKGNHNDVGWDIFSLDYLIDSPLHVFLNSNTMQSYLKLFNFLWRLKRIENKLNICWSNQMSLSSLVFKTNILVNNNSKQYMTYQSNQSTSQQHSGHVTFFLRSLHLIRSEMSHFISTFQHYVLFEAIEVGWVEFMNKITKNEINDLDTFVDEHYIYIHKILIKTMLGGNILPVSLLKQLLDIFQIIIKFCNFHEEVYQLAEKEKEREKELKENLKLKEKEGDWGIKAASNTNSTTPSFSSMLPLFTDTLTSITNNYHTLLFSFLSNLSTVNVQLTQLRNTALQQANNQQSAPTTSSSNHNHTGNNSNTNSNSNDTFSEEMNDDSILDFASLNAVTGSTNNSNSSKNNSNGSNNNNNNQRLYAPAVYKKYMEYLHDLDFLRFRLDFNEFYQNNQNILNKETEKKPNTSSSSSSAPAPSLSRANSMTRNPPPHTSAPNTHSTTSTARPSTSSSIHTTTTRPTSLQSTMSRPSSATTLSQTNNTRSNQPSTAAYEAVDDEIEFTITNTTTLK